MNCPVCNNVQLLMMERQGVEIDYCPQCRGVWLDRGELDKIIERSAAESKPANVHQEATSDKHYDKQYDKHYKEHGGPHYHRKKSFLEELFD